MAGSPPWEDWAEATPGELEHRACWWGLKKERPRGGLNPRRQQQRRTEDAVFLVIVVLAAEQVPWREAFRARDEYRPTTIVLCSRLLDIVFP